MKLNLFCAAALSEVLRYNWQLFRNFGKELQSYAAENPRRARISAQFFCLIWALDFRGLSASCPDRFTPGKWLDPFFTVQEVGWPQRRSERVPKTAPTRVRIPDCLASSDLLCWVRYLSCVCVCVCVCVRARARTHTHTHTLHFWV